MADPIHIVEAPERAPRKGGIRSVANFVSGLNRIAIGGQIGFVSPGCGDVYDNVMLCYPSPAAEQTEKTRDGIETLDGVVAAFGLYAGVECYLGGGDFEAQARTKLTEGEDRGVEEKLVAYLSGLTPIAPSADVVEAIAALEQAADGDYVGQPIIWMSRGDATLAKSKGVLEVGDDSSLTTANGTPVVASGKIARGTLAVTGSITVYQSDVEAQTAPAPTTNREMAIAERVYAVAIDCEYAQITTIGGA